MCVFVCVCVGGGPLSLALLLVASVSYIYVYYNNTHLRASASHPFSQRDLVCVKRDLVCVKRDLVCVKRDLVCVKGDLFCVKRDLVCVKRDLVCVKRDLVCVSLQTPSSAFNCRCTCMYLCNIHTHVLIHTHVRTALKLSANPSESNLLSVKMTTLSVYMRALSLSKILKSQYPSIFTLYSDYMLTFENLWTSPCHTAPCLCEQKQN